MIPGFVCFRRPWRRAVLVNVAGLILVSGASGAGPLDASSRDGHSRPAPEEIRSLHNFPKLLAVHFRELFREPNLIPLVIGGFSSVTANAADPKIRDYFLAHEGLGIHVGGNLFGHGLFMGPLIAGMLVTSQLSGRQNWAAYSYDLAQGFVLCNAIAGGLKAVTRRMRPNQESKTSFPSGHTANAFMWATTTAEQFGPRAGIPAFVVATYVGYSRLESNAHYLSDVVAGAVLGYIVGRTVSRKPATAKNQPRVQIRPALAPGGGVAVQVAIRVD